jgi:hypothetical protein
MQGVNVGVSCARCETLIIVMRPEMESDAEFAAHLATGETQTGSRLAIADVNGRYRCPACGTIGQLPPPKELSTD